PDVVRDGAALLADVAPVPGRAERRSDDELGAEAQGHGGHRQAERVIHRRGDVEAFLVLPELETAGDHQYSGAEDVLLDNALRQSGGSRGVDDERGVERRWLPVEEE